jgi:hypothetical protein
MLNDTELPDGVTLVAVAGLSTDSTFRSGGLCAEQINRLAEVGGPWPPILVRPDGLVIDGAHRVAAARRLGRARIEAHYFAGGPQDAFVEFVRRNVAQGLMLTLAERKQAAVRVLRVNAHWSDRRVADLCVLSPKTVGRLRLSVVPPNQKGAQWDAEVREGRDHRLRPARRGSVRGRVIEALRAQPEASLRTIASAVGVSPETVRLVRLNLASDPGDREGQISGPIVEPKPHIGTEPMGHLDSPSNLDWRSDPAITSSAHSVDLVGWLERTCVDSTDSEWIEMVPLSRVYLVAEEARRRSKAWLHWAQALEDRPGRAR